MPWLAACILTVVSCDPMDDAFQPIRATDRLESAHVRLQTVNTRQIFKDAGHRVEV